MLTVSLNLTHSHLSKTSRVFEGKTYENWCNWLINVFAAHEGLNRQNSYFIQKSIYRNVASESGMLTVSLNLTHSHLSKTSRVFRSEV